MALTDFYGLRGFRPLPEIAQMLEDIPELSDLAADFTPEPTRLREMYEHLMKLSQEEVDALLDPLVRRLTRENREKPFTRADREYWVLRSDGEFSKGEQRDRGLFSIYLLNLVHLQPGDAMFLPASILHAYLEGAGIEIMASSNNVLRGGLTSKHVDVPELLNNVAFEGGPVEILRGAQVPGAQEWIYETRAVEFELRRVEVSEARPYECDSNHGVEILILIESADDSPVHVASEAQTVELRKGRACLIPHQVAYTIRASHRSTLYTARIPRVPGRP